MTPKFLLLQTSYISNKQNPVKQDRQIQQQQYTHCNLTSEVQRVDLKSIQKTTPTSFDYHWHHNDPKISPLFQISYISNNQNPSKQHNHCYPTSEVQSSFHYHSHHKWHQNLSFYPKHLTFPTKQDRQILQQQQYTHSEVRGR